MWLTGLFCFNELISTASLSLPLSNRSITFLLAQWSQPPLAQTWYIGRRFSNSGQVMIYRRLYKKSLLAFSINRTVLKLRVLFLITQYVKITPLLRCPLRWWPMMNICICNILQTCPLFTKLRENTWPQSPANL